MSDSTEITGSLARQLFELARNRTFFGRSRRYQDTIALLQQVVALNELEALPSIAVHLFSRSSEVKAAACRAVHQLLSNADAGDLLHLTDVIGWSWGWYVSEQWNNLRPKNVASVVADESARASVLGLVSFHRNGYVRHEAIKQLVKIESGLELPYLLIRQNDWVDPISADSWGAVHLRLKQDYLPHFVRYLPLCVHLLAFSRRDHEGVVRRIVELLVQSQSDASLAAAIRSSSRNVRREVVRISLLLDGEHKKRVVMYGQDSEDPLVRLQCCRAVRQCFSRDELRAVLDVFARDRFMPVRREALKAHVESYPNESLQVWKTALIDSSASIRELARFSIANTTNFDSAAFYRNAVAHSAESLAAFEGLTEVGTESDLPVIRSQLAHPLTRWRRAAVRGLASIGGIAVTNELVKRLCDDSPSVVGTVRRQLEKVGTSDANPQLFQIASEDHRGYVCDAALRLIFDSGKWEGLPWLIKLASHRDLHQAEAAQEFIERWFSPPLVNKVWTKPSEHERSLLHHAWVESQGAIPDAFHAELQRWINTI